MPVLTQGPEKCYASALFDLAVEQKALKDVAVIAESLAQALELVPNFLEYLKNEIVFENEKTAAMLQVCDALKASEMVKKFMRFLGEQKRTDVLQGILFILINWWMKMRGV